jgi:O-antigen ligase
LFLALALAAYGSSYASTLVWLAALLALVWSTRYLEGESNSRTTILAFCIGGLALWILLSHYVLTPPSTAHAPYHAAFLAAGFLFGRRAGAADVALVFRIVLTLAVLASVWGLWQYLTQPDGRGQSVFNTPAAFAAALNLLLVPGLLIVVLGRGPWPLIAALVLPAAALVATQSRGGWLALLAGVLVASLLVRRAHLRLQARPIAIMLALLALGWLIAQAAGSWSGGAHLPADYTPQAASVSRLELYHFALASLAPSTLVTGLGFHGFYYLLEAGRAAVPSYTVGMTYFVHNDYLQMLLELGVPGLLGLLLLALLPAALAWRALPRLPEDDRAAAVAITAGLASMAAHALVDFPFYIPYCLLLYGVGVGMLDRMLAVTAAPADIVPAAPRGPLRRAASAAAATLIVWLLGAPAAAEAASAYGQHQWLHARAQSAAFWFEAARRIDPRDWRYHWYAGQFWLAQASRLADPQAAALADRAFAAGLAANPREIRNLYDRMFLHRRFRSLLASPADAATMRAWADRALQMAPLDPAVRAEANLVKKQFPG